MKRARGSKLLALVMAAIMLFSLLPVSVFAAELPEDNTANTAANIAAGENGEDPAALQEEPQDEDEPQNEEALSSTDETTEADGETTEPAVEPITAYSDFITSLTTLEAYANAYVLEHPAEEAVALVINYIRCGVEKYTSGTWTTFCGPEKTAFTSYVAEKDAENSTSAGRLRSLNEFTLPNGNEVDFTHMFGAMDMAYHTKNQNTADLGSWAGDICDLVQLTTQNSLLSRNLRHTFGMFRRQHSHPSSQTGI